MTSVFRLALRGHELLVAVGGCFRSPLLLAIRLYWGWQFCNTGSGHLRNLSQITGYFHELGIPLPQVSAVLAGTTECAGGLLLIVGLASRFVTLPLIFTMLVAYLTAENEALKGIFSNPDGFVTATPFLFLFASALIFVFGPGAFSLDHLLCRKFGKGGNPDPG